MKKFFAAIGNPPYQGQNHMQIYPDFYLQAQEVADCVEMIFPTGWQEPKKANNLAKMNTKDVKEDRQIVFVDNVHNAFPSLASVEWTNVVMWKSGHDNGLDGFQRVRTNGANEQIVHFSTDESELKIPDIMRSALEKVLSHHAFTSLSTVILRSESYRFTEKMHIDFPDIESMLSAGHKYDLKSSVLTKLDNIVFFNNPGDNKSDYVQIMGLIKSQRTTKWIKAAYIDGSSDFRKYKLFVAEAAASGDFGGRLSNTIIAGPNVGHTQTFISIGQYDSKQEAINTEKYIKTKFARALLFTLKKNQHNGVGTWANIPLQDFTLLSDIDWSRSIAEIDQQLYKKYGLSPEEIEFIETHVKEMN